jgi:uncharacterized surface protein with fasciclin (FAS1) repeats
MKIDRSKRSALSFVGVGMLALAIMTVVAIRQPAYAECHEKGATGDIVETAVAAGNFETLVTALKAADLVDALKGEGPFTVFAPTDEAFGKLPANALNDLLKPENKEKLRAILLYHVVPGKYSAAEVMKLDGQQVATLQGSKVDVKTKHGVMVGSARVIKTDLMTSNGIIHVIDTVIMPPAKRSGM